MRVLQLIDSLAPAGAEQSLVALAPHLQERGVELHVAYLIDRDGLRDRLAGVGVSVVDLGTSGRSRRTWLATASRVIGDLSPDLVHTTLFEADLVGRLAGARHRVPVVSSLVNTAYGRTERTAAGLRRSRVLAAQAADAATAPLVTRFHAVTPHVATVMRRRLLLRRSRIDVVHRGRDPEVLGRRTTERRLATRARLGLARDTPLVLAVGRQEAQKGLDVLVRALPTLLRRYPDTRVLVAGRSGAATPVLRGLLGDLGLDRAMGFLGARDDVPDLLAAADAFAFPSRWEGAAGTLLEAMALECPIVSSDLATLSGTIDARTATLVPTDQPEALAMALALVLDDPRGAATRAAVGYRRFLDRFTITASADGMVGLYRRALEGRGPRSPGSARWL